MATIADILLARGRSEGDARRRQGESSAALWSNLGNTIGSSLITYAQQREQQKEQEPILKQEQQIRDLRLQGEQADANARKSATEADAGFSADLSKWDGKPESLMRSAVQRYGAAGAAKAKTIWEGFEALQGDPQKKYKDTQALLRDVLLGMNETPEDIRAQIYPQVRNGLVQRGVITEQDAPLDYDANWWQSTIKFGQEPPNPVAVEGVSPEGNPQTEFVLPEVGTTVQKPAPKMTLQEQANAALKAGDTTEYARLRRVLRDTSADGRAPEKPEDPLARRERELRVQKLEQDLKTAAAGGTNNSKVDAIRPVLDEIEKLAGDIFTEPGLMANVVGTARSLMAKGNIDADVKVYQALVRGMTPMLARAVGHTGVLTEMDVARTEELFPMISVLGTDSKGVADRKIQMFQKLMAGQAGEDEKQQLMSLMGWDGSGKAPTSVTLTSPGKVPSGRPKVYLDNDGNPR